MLARLAWQPGGGTALPGCLAPQLPMLNRTLGVALPAPWLQVYN